MAGRIYFFPKEAYPIEPDKVTKASRQEPVPLSPFLYVRKKAERNSMIRPSIVLGRLLLKIARARGGGSAFPGLVVEKTDPRLLRDVLSSLPLGTAVVLGTNGKDHTEGILYQNAIGTYLHGPLLPKNPKIADFLILTALQRRDPSLCALSPLDDSAEDAARANAAARPK